MMTGAGMKVLDGTAYERDGVGFAGTKGFVGGFGRGSFNCLRRARDQAVCAGLDRRMPEAGARHGTASYSKTRRGHSLFTHLCHHSGRECRNFSVSRYDTAGRSGGSSRRRSGVARPCPSRAARKEKRSAEALFTTLPLLCTNAGNHLPLIGCSISKAYSLRRCPMPQANMAANS